MNYYTKRFFVVVFYYPTTTAYSNNSLSAKFKYCNFIQIKIKASSPSRVIFDHVGLESVILGQSGFYAVSDNMVLERPAVNQRGGNMGASDSISRSMPRWNEHKLAQLAAEVDDPDFQRRSSRLDQWRELSRQAAQERNCEVPFPDQIEWLVLHPMCWSFAFFWKIVLSYQWKLLFITGLGQWCIAPK